MTAAVIKHWLAVNFILPKREIDGHGYGIQNMERMVKSYNGRMEYNVDPEWVTVDIFLQQKDEI